MNFVIFLITQFGGSCVDKNSKIFGGLQHPKLKRNTDCNKRHRKRKILLHTGSIFKLTYTCI